MGVLKGKLSSHLTMMTRIRRYSELRRLVTFSERFEYLMLNNSIGEKTFGFDRWLNQEFYHSREWKSARNKVILRDNGCDLGVPGYELYAGLLIHHINPMSERDLIYGDEWIIDPEYLITTSLATHNAIHFGNASLLPRPVVQRTSGDTRLW